MNEYITLLRQVDFVSYVFATVVLMGAIVFGKELLEKFCDVINYEPKWIREKKEMKECQETVKKEIKKLSERQDSFEAEHKKNVKARDDFNQTVIESMGALKEDIDALGKRIEMREIEKQFKKLRYDILNFADRIMNSETINAELMDVIFDEIKTYHDFVEKYDFENGKVDISIKVINDRYEELFKAGKVYKEND